MSKKFSYFVFILFFVFFILSGTVTKASGDECNGVSGQPDPKSCGADFHCVDGFCSRPCTYDTDCSGFGKETCYIGYCLRAGGGGTESTIVESKPAGVSGSGPGPETSDKTINETGINVVSGIDSRCWTEKDCIQRKTEIGVSATQAKSEGLYQGTDSIAACGGTENPSGEKIGFCSAISNTETSVTFGNRNIFSGLDDFIVFMYQYSIIIIAVLAVIMVAFAGFSWVVSAGSAEKITQAKKRIGSALIGLVLALLSYSILNTINPFLINFRAPSVWLINPIEMQPVFCSEVKDKKLAVAYKDIEKISDAEIANRFNQKKNTDFNLEPLEGECGVNYFPQESKGQTCLGDICAKKSGLTQVCIDKKCEDGMLAGKVKGTLGVFGAPAVDSENSLMLIALCRSHGEIEKVSEIKYTSNKTNGQYKFPYNPKIETACSDEDGVVGFYIGVEVNDETYGTGSVFGSFTEGAPWSFGTDDWHAVGKTGPKSHNCSANLSTRYQGQFFNTKNCGPSNIFCTCSYMSYPTIAYTAANDKKFNDYLISLDELKNGYMCDINISRSNFPSADNTVKWPSAEELAQYSMGGATAGAISAGVAGSIFPVVGNAIGAASGAIIGGITAPTLKLLTSFAPLFDDPTSCLDKN